MNSSRLIRFASLTPLLSPACSGEERGSTTSGVSVTGGSGASGSGSGTGAGDTDPGTTDAGSAGSATSSGDGDTDGPGGSSGSSGDDGGIRLDVGNASDASGGGLEGGSGAGCESISVLFVVDISGSMKEERSNLAANFPQFVSVLDAYVGDPSNGARSYRLGVTNSSIVNNVSGNSSMGLDGALYGGGVSLGCSRSFTPPWIDGPAPTVSDDFTCLANYPVPNGGSDVGAERPLDAIEYFIDKSAPGGVNEGFYEPSNSLFVVVTLTDEDDTQRDTTTTPAQTKAKLDTFARGSDRYVVVTIAGPQGSACTSAFGQATAAPVLHEFTSAVDNGLMGDICEGDLSTPLADALDLIQISCDELPPPVG